MDPETLKQLEPVQEGRRILEPKPHVRLEIVEDTNRELNLIGERVDEALRLTDKGSAGLPAGTSPCLRFQNGGRRHSLSPERLTGYSNEV